MIAGRIKKNDTQSDQKEKNDEKKITSLHRKSSICNMRNYTNGHLQIKEILQNHAKKMSLSKSDILVLQPTSIGTGIDYNYFYKEYLASLCTTMKSDNNKTGSEDYVPMKDTVPRSKEGNVLDSECVRIVWPSYTFSASCADEWAAHGSLGQYQRQKLRMQGKLLLSTMLHIASKQGLPKGCQKLVNLKLRKIISNGCAGAASAALVVAVRTRLKTGGMLFHKEVQENLPLQWNMIFRLDSEHFACITWSSYARQSHS